MTSSAQIRILILSREVGYLFWVWMNLAKYCKTIIILCYFVNKSSYWFIVFGKCFSSFKFKALLSNILFYYFDELLIFFWITLVDILCFKFKSKNYSTKIHITMETSVEIRAKKKIHFHLSQMLTWRIHVL